MVFLKYEIRNAFFETSSKSVSLSCVSKCWDIQQKYVQRKDADQIDFVDPLLMIEDLEELFLCHYRNFLSVGTWDPLVEDTKRLYEAVKKRRQVWKSDIIERNFMLFKHALSKASTDMLEGDVWIFRRAITGTIGRSKVY